MKRIGRVVSGCLCLINNLTFRDDQGVCNCTYNSRSQDIMKQISRLLDYSFSLEGQLKERIGVGSVFHDPRERNHLRQEVAKPVHPPASGPVVYAEIGVGKDAMYGDDTGHG